MEWTNHQACTYKMTPNYLAVYIANNLEFESVVDLGCGSGNETVYFVRKGKKVTAVDSTLNEEYILDRLKKSEKENVTLVEKPFEELELPKCDAVFSSFSLPFCSREKFSGLWREIEEVLPKGGIVAGNLFGERCFFKDSRDVNIHTESQVKELLKGYDIVKWKEQEYDREDGKHWHYYDFVAIKK